MAGLIDSHQRDWVYFLLAPTCPWFTFRVPPSRRIACVLTIALWSGVATRQAVADDLPQPFDTDLGHATANEAASIAQSRGLAERNGDTLVLWYDHDRRGQGLVFRDWLLPETDQAEGDAEAYRYLGGEAHYQAVLINEQHDAPTVEVIALPSRRVRDYWVGDGFAYPSPTNTRIIAVRMWASSSAPLFQVTNFELQASGSLDSAPLDEITCQAPRAARPSDEGMYAKLLKFSDDAVVLEIHSESWPTPNKQDVRDLGTVSFARNGSTWVPTAPLPAGLEQVSCK